MTRLTSLFAATALSSTLMAGAAHAQTAPQTPPPAQDDEVYDLGEVTVSASRPRGSVDSDIPPDIVLDEEMIRTYGAGNIQELIAALEPLTQSSRGRGGGQPIFLLNGRRVSSPREIFSIPTEALERTEILPEDVALAYGYRADQRVVNFVLKPTFRSVTLQADGRAATAGGRTQLGADADFFRVDGLNRSTFDIEYRRAGALFEDERDIVRSDSGRPFSRRGTVTGLLDDGMVGEIDPALSALAGSTVTMALAPLSAANGPVGLDAFVAGAGLSGSEDLTESRTLLPRTESIELKGSITRDLSQTLAGTISGSIQDQSSQSFLGLPGSVFDLGAGSPFSPFSNDVLVYRLLDAPESLTRDVDTRTLEGSGQLDGYLGDWRWTLTGNYSRVETDTRTGQGLDDQALQDGVAAGTINPFGPIDASQYAALPSDTANSIASTAGAEMVVRGKLFDLPAGGVNATLTAGADTRSLDSTSVRSGVTTDRSQSRDRGNVSANLNLPLTSRDREVFGWVGDLSANFNAGYQELSDFGGLTSLDVGLNWSPIEKLSFNVGFAGEEGAPSVQQLNDPVVLTPNVPVFDFATGQTVNITRIDGGNPNLAADDRSTLRVGMNFRPFESQDLRLQANYTRSEIKNSIATFPTITPDLEAALPERFERDADGNLISIDARPLNFASTNRQDIRWGLNYSRAFGRPTAPQRGEGGPGGQRGPGGGRGGEAVVLSSGGPPPGGGGGGMQFRGGPGGGGPGGRGRGPQMQPGQGRFNVSLFHTYRIQDEIRIRDELPVIDLLDGAAVGSRGGQPRNEVQFQAGVFRNGFGGFLNATWRDSTRVDGGPTGETLFFDDQSTVNLNLFADLSSRTAWVERYPLLKGARITLGVENLFDSRLQVRNALGVTPQGYQPDYLDPQGRVVRLTLRKLIF
jgi:hypothetical protein